MSSPRSRGPVRFATRFGLAAAALLLAGCGEDNVAPPRDVTAPAAVTDLAVIASDDTSATLTWTAPGDDGASGTAASYDVRHAADAITAGTWNSATQATGEPVPRAAGARDTMMVTGLAPGARSFAMRTIDDADNVSALSNVVSISAEAADRRRQAPIPGRNATPAGGARRSR